MGSHAVYQLTEQAVADGFAGGVVRVSDYAEINTAEALEAGGGVITLDLEAPDGLAAAAALDAFEALERVVFPDEVPVESVPQAPQALVVASPPPEAAHAAEREREARENAELAAMEAEQDAEQRQAAIDAEREAFLAQRERERIDAENAAKVAAQPTPPTDTDLTGSAGEDN